MVTTKAIRQRALLWSVLIPFLPFAVACGSSGLKPDGGGTLPDCNGAWPAAWVQKEQQLLTALNAARAQGGTCSGQSYPAVSPVTQDSQLTQISRCFARDQMLAGSQALAGADANAALRDRVVAANYPGQLTGYAGDITAASVNDVIASFLASSTYCAALFDPTTNVSGAGYVEDATGVVPQRWAGVTAFTGDGAAP